MSEICISCGSRDRLELLKENGFRSCCPERDMFAPVEMRARIKDLEAKVVKARVDKLLTEKTLYYRIIDLEVSLSSIIGLVNYPEEVTKTAKEALEKNQ